MAWNEERVEMLRALWKAGVSGRDIAARLGDVSRNAVIGKAHRLGLEARNYRSVYVTDRPRTEMIAATRRQPRFVPGNAVKKRRPPKQPFVVGHAPDAALFGREAAPLPPPAEFDVARVSFLDLNEDGKRHCKWPCLPDVAGIPQDQPMFCGLKPFLGLPYCEVHARRAYQPPEARRRERVPQPVESHAAVVRGSGDLVA